MPPDNFKPRNKALIGAIKAVCGTAGFDEVHSARDWVWHRARFVGDYVRRRLCATVWTLCVIPETGCVIGQVL